MASASGSKSSEVGFTQWCNSKTLSDVTVKYGTDGEREFFGHKMVLAASSIWFRNAFFGNFAESEEKEIVLKDDDPDAVTVMLKACYAVADRVPYSRYRPWRDEEMEATKETNDLLLYHLKVYQVADKYEVPYLRDCIQTTILSGFQKWLANLEPPISNTSIKQLREVIHFFYDVTAIKGPSNSFRAGFANNMLYRKSCQLFGDCGSLTFTIRQLCKEIPEFAQDLLLASLELTNSGISCTTVHKKFVQCPDQDCSKMFYKEDNGIEDAYCPQCGKYAKKFREVVLSEDDE